MELLDDTGRLFGVVNVVDALAVLLFVSLLVAGVAVVGGFGGGEGETVTRYATVDLGEQPAYVADRLAAGDRSSVGPAAGNVTVTDVFVTAGNGSDTATSYARVSVEGRLSERQNRSGTVFTYAGRPLPVGTPLTFSGTNYSVTGAVTEVDGTGDALDVDTVPVRVAATVSQPVAATVAEGDEYRIAGRTIATVTDVASYPTANPDRQFLSVGLELRTVRSGGTQQFGGRPVTLGTTVPFRTDAYTLRGTVVQRGDDALPGESVTTRATVEVTEVSPAVADELRTGTTEVVGERTLATVTAVARENATVVIQGENTQIVAREHPIREDVTLTLDLRTQRTARGLRFHGRPLTVGRSVTFDFGTVRVTGTVTGLDR